MRLIDADKLLRDPYFIEDRYPESHLLRMAIGEQRTVEAVEVVRCKECKYWTEGRHHTGRCGALVQFHDAERYLTDAGHFCSYGERKQEKC